MKVYFVLCVLDHSFWSVVYVQKTLVPSLEEPANHVTFTWPTWTKAAKQYRRVLLRLMTETDKTL